MRRSRHAPPPPVAALVVHEVWQVGEDETHSPARHRPYEGNAVAVKDQITEVRCRVCIAGHGLCPLFRQEQSPLFLCLAASSGVATTRADWRGGDHRACTERSAGRPGKPLRATPTC